ncbi:MULTISPECIES: MarR family winged helix-turn-helix transcriptional regulator [unclassified Pusillimonas]|uniref:MarR family winged helix-turn-helix transcriptional regulator n=1 Tax=unclassified Pusillimonas TaxID=2640016 RepID=UPI000B946491|nr:MULTISPECIES: MarR family transcriptional regulator [unclassified Pusillimonas]OXR49165.1 transcriptional regulator [Pusillimonas sp. T2]ROT46044.1 MarR family transcriptional regulator [Pusillimonas sp. NJUB218]
MATTQRTKTKKPVSTPQLSDEDWSLQQNIAFRMACVIFRMDQELRDSVLRKLDLTYAHFRVLQVLFEKDGQQIGDIARSIVMRQPALSRVIDQMEVRKLVQRKQDKDDSRYMRVYLTKTGKQHYEQAWPAAHQIMTRALEVVSNEERSQLCDVLIRMDNHMQET